MRCFSTGNIDTAVYDVQALGLGAWQRTEMLILPEGLGTYHILSSLNNVFEPSLPHSHSNQFLPAGIVKTCCLPTAVDTVTLAPNALTASK